MSGVHGVDLPEASPAEYLSWDDAFLDRADQEGVETLWFWESRIPFVVVGYGQAVAREVHPAACADRGIPILRRCSGGGTVVQGQGCLNYGLALPIAVDANLSTISAANRFILNRHCRALTPLLGTEVRVEGHTDLVMGSRAGGTLKFSGNAQRRTQRALLFHGTFLLDMDLELMASLLPPPSWEPAYRAGRPHTTFVANTGLGRRAVCAVLREAWGAMEVPDSLPVEAQRRALDERYGRSDWNLRR